MMMDLRQVAFVDSVDQDQTAHQTSTMSCCPNNLESAIFGQLLLLEKVTHYYSALNSLLHRYSF